ncbi:gliding motility protein GldB-related protein [Pedobacter steynii]
MNFYKKYYTEPGSNGLQDYLAYKIKNLKNFVKAVNTKPAFYSGIRKNTYTVDQQKAQMIQSFVKFKQIYNKAQFPDIYFVIGAFNSGGTSTDAGLLIGLDQSARTEEVPVKELTLWQQNNFTDLKELPNLIAHELIHFNQGGLAGDTTLLAGAITEGMADFIGELISGKTANERLFVWAKGKEKQVWADFEKEMYLNKSRNWIANSDQETVDKPADLGYWVGYQICKAYYNQSTDKTKAVNDILNIKNYKEFYEKSGAGQLFN